MMDEEQILKRFDLESTCLEIYKELKAENDFFPATNDIQMMEPILKVIPGMSRKGDITYDAIELQAILATPDFVYKRSVLLGLPVYKDPERRKAPIKDFIREFKRDMTIWPKK